LIIGTYEEARHKLPQYGDAESANVENRGRGKQKKKPNTWKTNSDSESDVLIKLLFLLDKLKVSTNKTTPVSPK